MLCSLYTQVYSDLVIMITYPFLQFLGHSPYDSQNSLILYEIQVIFLIYVSPIIQTHAAVLLFAFHLDHAFFARLYFSSWNSDCYIYLFIFSWRIPWTEEPGGLQSMGSLGVGHD